MQAFFISREKHFKTIKGQQRTEMFKVKTFQMYLFTRQLTTINIESGWVRCFIFLSMWYTTYVICTSTKWPF